MAAAAAAAATAAAAAAAVDAGLPTGWAVAKLSDVTAKVGNIKPEEEPERVFQYVDISGIDNEVFEIVRTKEFSGVNAPSRAKRPMCSGDILFSNVRTYLKNIAVVPEELDDQVASTGFTLLRSNGAVLSKYLYRWVLTDRFVGTVTSQQTGSSYPATTDRVVREQPIPLPPLAEQERIVVKVEALLSRVQSVRQRLATVPGILKHFCQAILAHACSGKLTEDWRNHQDQTPESDKELPAGWQRQALRDRCSKFEYGSSQKSDTEGDVPVLRMGNIQDGRIDWTNLKFSSDADEIAKYSLSPNTVLFNRTNSPELVGKTAIYRGERPAIFAGYLIRIVHESELDPEYLNYCLNEQSFREYCMQVKSDGVSQSNINAKKLAAYEIPYPPVEEQREIVSRVVALFALARSIEHRVQAAMTQAEALTQSILARAFRGELVPTEAELARTEDRNYETAEQLLIRIREEPAQRTPTKYKGRSKKRSAISRPHFAQELDAIVKHKLIKVLKDADHELTPEELFKRADLKPQDVDEFYEELRYGVATGDIIEERPDDTLIYLRVK